MSQHDHSAHLPGTFGPDHVDRDQPGVPPQPVDFDGHDPIHGHDGHHGGVGKYLLVFAALCVLTGASFFTYSAYWPFGKHVAWAFMMAVSCTKAMLVIMFFMHLLWEANWKWVLTVPASFMSVFLTLMLVPDIGWRQDNGFARYSRDRLRWAANQPAIEASDQRAAEADEREHGGH